MKFDNQKYDERNNLLCYLYLKNKTFINAHIIKEGLVDVDSLADFKYKTKFLNLQGIEWQGTGIFMDLAGTRSGQGISR